MGTKQGHCPCRIIKDRSAMDKAGFVYSLECIVDRIDRTYRVIEPCRKILVIGVDDI